MTPEATVAKLRSFIAIPLQPELLERVAQLQRQLLAACPELKPAQLENLHLTLRFLGDRTQDELAQIGRIMLSVAEKKNIFNVTLEGVGVFPHPRRPRILWLGLTPQDDLLELHSQLSDTLAQAGIAPDPKPFRPHLTLGRFKARRPQAISLRPFLSHCCGSMSIDRLILFRSRLTAQGAIHTPLETAQLATPAE